MKTQSNPSLRKSVALGALLFLAATASGCGVGLPTQPAVDTGVVNERGAGAAGIQATGDSFELGDSGAPGGGSGGSEVPAGEIVIPRAPGPGVGSGWAYGHQKNRLKNRH